MEEQDNLDTDHHEESSEIPLDESTPTSIEEKEEVSSQSQDAKSSSGLNAY